MPVALKLLFVMYDKPNYPGGPIINYIRLLPQLVQRKCTVHVLVIYQKDYPNARGLQKQGIAIHPIARSYTEPMVKWILQKVEEIQPDVFIPDISTPGCFAGTWVMNAGIPVINSHRSDDKLNWGKAIYFTDPKYQHALTGIVCVSEYLRHELKKTVASSPTLSTVIPSGVPVPEFISNQDSDMLKIVYAGRLIEKQKRAGAMIESFLNLCEKSDKLVFTIIGDGPERQKCIDRVRNSAFHNRFTFTGNLQGDRYKRELANHHVIVLLSDYEGTPGAIMDGMSCGLIPVCLEYNGASELISHGQNGFLVINRDTSLQQVITLLLEDHPRRTNLSQAARETIIGSYSLEIATERWLEFMRLCIQTMGTKRHFEVPAKIKLPAHDPLLVEDKRLAHASFMGRLKAGFSVIPYLRKLFST